MVSVHTETLPRHIRGLVVLSELYKHILYGGERVKPRRRREWDDSRSGEWLPSSLAPSVGSLLHFTVTQSNLHGEFELVAISIILPHLLCGRMMISHF